MPYKQVLAEEPRTYPDLTAVLAEELALRRPDGPEDAPYIIEEGVPRSDHVHVTVIWDRWSHIAPEDRGRIILDAYQQVRGTAGVLAISVALGLTHPEAKRLGLE